MSAQLDTVILAPFLSVQVAESSPLSEAVLKKGDSNNASFKKVPSLQRRPSFSRRVQLEVV